MRQERRMPDENGVSGAVIDLSGKVAVVTGAGSGIGRAIAVELAGHGAVLCLVGRRIEALNTVAETISTTAARVQCYAFDLTSDEDIAVLRRRITEDSGRVDVLIHSAGLFALGSLETARIDDFDNQYRTNVRAPYLLTQALLPMLKNSRGQIAFINSSSGLTARANISQYAATKFALKAMTDSLREEINPYGIRVLSVYPGRTATPMQAMIYEQEGKTYSPERLLQPEDVASVVVHSLTLPQTAEVTDIRIRPMLKS
jgi:NADP-dependent 3-hydroxy acid dehydrogenase YdfG